MTERKDVLGVISIFLVGVLLRLLRLGHQGLWLDEAWSWATTQLPSAQILQLSFHDPHSPLYYLLLKVFLVVLPDTEAGLRVPSALCSIMVLAITLAYVARRWGSRAAIYAGWFMALSSFDLYYAQEARMYTLLGLLWFLTYILLAEAMRGHSRLLIAWGLASTMMAWTHFYGLLAAGVHLVFALIFWGWHRYHARPCPISGRWLGVSMTLASAGVLPSLFLLWSHRASNAGGAWVPQAKDLPTLFALWSVGLTAARTHFLDSSHLVLPSFAPLSLWAWVLIGFLISGGFAAWRLGQGWESGGPHRWEALLALALTVVPVAAAFGYASALGHRMWAFKPFLGAAYMFYLWSGIGLSRTSPSSFRRGIAIISLGVSLVSLIPYYTAWQKTDAATALRALPTTEEQGLVLLERAYRAPVARYYLGDSVQVWGFRPDGENSFALTQVIPNDPRPINCDSPIFQQVKHLWVYGPTERIRQERDNWPGCLSEKSLWIFENGKWISFNR